MARQIDFYLFCAAEYVKNRFVIRLKRTPTEEQRKELESQFGDLAKDGTFELSGPLEGETSDLELSRLHFIHTRRDFGKLSQLLDAINMLSEQS